MAHSLQFGKDLRNLLHKMHDLSETESFHAMQCGFPAGRDWWVTPPDKAGPWFGYMIISDWRVQAHDIVAIGMALLAW